jgi:hypothetical protein
MAVVNQCDHIGLAQVLIGGEHARSGRFDAPEERQDRRGIRKLGLEAEPVGQVGLALADIVVERNMNVISDTVVEAKSIRTNPGLLERKDRNSGGQIWLRNA